MLEDERDLLGAEHEVDRHHHGAQAREREVEHRVLPAIVGEHGHALSLVRRRRTDRAHAARFTASSNSAKLHRTSPETSASFAGCRSADRRSRSAMPCTRACRTSPDPLSHQTSAHHEHVERARPVNALDALELDVGGGRRAGDERDRPPGHCAASASRATASGTEATTCSSPDHAQVVVGHERQRPPARAPRRRRARSCRSRRSRARSPSARRRGASRSRADNSGSSRTSSTPAIVRRRLGRYREPQPAPRSRHAAASASASPPLGDAVDGRTVVRDALAEQLHVGGRRRRPRGSRARRRAGPRACRRGPSGCGRGRPRGRSSRPAALAPATSPGTSASGMSGRSRIAVQPLSIGIAPSRPPSGPRPSLARRCARS